MPALTLNPQGMGVLSDDVILLIYPELDSWETVASLSSVNHRFRDLFLYQQESIKRRVYAREYAITRPKGHQDAFRLARYMTTNVLHSNKTRIGPSDLTWKEIEQLQANQAAIQYLQDRFLEIRREQKSKARNEDLTCTEVDKFCQAATRFWIFCVMFADNPRSRADQKSLVESWCFNTASELQYIRELILFLWRLLRDSIPESEEHVAQAWAEKVGIRCFSTPGGGPSDTKWIDFLMSRGCGVLFDLVKQESVLKRVLYIAKSPFGYRTDAADYVFLCGSAVNQVMAEWANTLPTRPYGILDKCY
ncbi:hypothetical protein TWF106_000971 [Orbilia oligospora]|uniref:F-box domain-containing protein n=1 Tax=Orbilia oligospora TaxID=2813651 RepID=A0A7C8QKX4_ORBOL|nr:hypothetical protein TWF788_011113 [Orbilia oligospora]KAF3205985.1 hypothetical protein TWF106_000971 [Orbilia oligospora]KAF3216533.1 hypothetical protein TWF191_009019 [Orbilia oligospora]KAF3223564.1 hypothetical protein TWF679_000011 [Orbilia oligospora]